MNKLIKPYGTLFLATAAIAVSGMSCSHSATEKPYDAVVVDRSNPEHTVVEFNGACAAGVEHGKYDIPGRKEFSVTTNSGKTYYFSTASARDGFMKNFDENSKKADDMWLSRAELESNSVANSTFH